MSTKIAILGAGRVGTAAAYRIASEQLCDEIILTDLDMEKARGEAADLQDAATVTGSHTRIRAGSYFDCADAALCILSVASRVDAALPILDQLDRAAAVVGRVVPSLMATGFSGIILVLSHPVEIMTWLTQQLSDLPDTQVIGLGAVLDEARLRLRLAELLDVPPAAVSARVLGIHDGEQAVPWDCVSVAGKPVQERLPDLDPKALFNTIADITYQIRQVKGAATFGAASATAQVVRAILWDTGEILPVCAMPHGQYGIDDVYLCVPCALGREGVREVMEYRLGAGEQARLQKIVRSLRQHTTEKL